MSLASSVRCKIKIPGTKFLFDLLSSSRSVQASFMGGFRIEYKEIQSRIHYSCVQQSKN